MTPTTSQFIKTLQQTPLSVPGLRDLNNLHINIPGIPDFSLPTIANPFAQFSLVVPQFSLSCPRAPGAVEPTWPPH